MLLGAIALAGLAVRVAYVLVERRDVEYGGDSFFYHEGANLLADGKGFISALDYLDSPYDIPVGREVEAADHPPLYLVWLALPSFVGLTGTTAHLLWSCVLGTATVAVAGLAGREVAGPRAGLLAAGFAAVYPNMWVYDGFLLSETMAILTASLAVLCAYRFWKGPSTGRIVALGVVCGLAALSRSELLLLAPLVLAPLALRAAGATRRRRWQWLAVGAVAVALPIAPWVGYNLTRFEKPVFLSTGFEVTLTSANCDPTYYGETLGYWNFGCVAPVRVQAAEDGLDQSEEATRFRRTAFDYIGDHLGRVPVVVAARWGRITGLYRPTQQVQLDQVPEAREAWVAWSAQIGYYVVALLAIGGVIALRRRRVVVYPLLALPAIVMVAVTVTFATTRYRASAEPALVILAGVAVDAWLRGRVSGERRGDTGSDRRDRSSPASPPGAAASEPAPPPRGSASSAARFH